jgi:outer membrane receptor protein involved in Fe transport
LEIVPQAQLTPDLSLSGGYQYLDEIDQTTGLPVDTRPRHLIDGELDYRLRGRWAIHAWATYTADQVISSRTTPVTQMHLPNYALFNLRLSRLFGPHTRLYVEADNLFNKRYEFAPGLPGAGQMLVGGGEIGF